MPKLVSISLATNWLRQKVLKIPLADSCLNSKYCVFPIDTSSQRQTDMRDLLLAISVEFPASDGRFLKIIDSRNGATLLHSSTSINAFLSGRTSVSTPNSSIIYKVDQESVADLKRLAIKNLNDATIELSALDLIETRIRNCAQWRLYLARWGLLGYLTTELGVIVFLTYEVCLIASERFREGESARLGFPGTSNMPSRLFYNPPRFWLRSPPTPTVYASKLRKLD